MDIKQVKLKMTCHQCNNEFICTFNTVQCPFCNQEFEPENIHRAFYQYETALMNNKAYRAGEKMDQVGKGLETFGKGISQIGCALTLLFFIVIFLLLFL